MHGVLLCAEFPIKRNSMALSLLANNHILNSRIRGILGEYCVLCMLLCIQMVCMNALCSRDSIYWNWVYRLFIYRH